MPFVQITWLPKACRTAQVRQEIAKAVMKVMVAHDKADIVPDNLVVRFSETVDGFPSKSTHNQTIHNFRHLNRDNRNTYIYLTCPLCILHGYRKPVGRPKSGKKLPRPS